MLRAIILFVLLAGLAASQASAQVMVTGPATTVWSWSQSTKCNGGDDFPDVPVRPFVTLSTTRGGSPTIRWFASNASNIASVSTGSGPDPLASIQRGTATGQSPSCAQMINGATAPPVPPYYPGSAPSTYDTALWMASPIVDGQSVHALLHNEFHGDWTGSSTWCGQQTKTIYLPCSYWNIVSASSADFGVSFNLRQASPGVNVPAIALPNPYVVANTGGPQGMVAQSNILRSSPAILYVLALQLLAPGASQPSMQGACIWRSSSGATWKGWDGTGWNIDSPKTYPTAPASSLCKPVLPGAFRSSWSFNALAGPAVIVLGQDTLANLQAKGVSTTDCPYAPGASAATADAAFVYIVASKLPMSPAKGSPATSQLQLDTETCLLQINSINVATTNTRHAYPSLLDPTSPTIQPGDTNYMHTGTSPYLYFTQMNPFTPSPTNNGWNRDLVRMAVTVKPQGP